MSTLMLNGKEVEVVVIAANGITDETASLTNLEQTMILAIDAALKADAEFLHMFQEAQLVRVDSILGLKDTEKGRFYLRYKHSKGMTEYFGNVGKKLKINNKRGVVTVVVKS